MEINKESLAKFLSEEISNCKKGMDEEPAGSSAWAWCAARKTLAESIIRNFT